MSPSRQRGFVLIGLILAGLVALALLAALVLGLAAAWYWNELPPLDKATDYRPRQHLQVLTADGAEIAKFGTERRIFVPIAQTPKRVIDALLAVEDTGFYEHGAISWRGLARATLANLTPGGTPQGASTITQQVARTFFLSTRRTAERKIKEALLAWQLESRLSKDQILELYMNQVYMGQRAYGFAAAAQVYLGKTLDQLTIAETAMVAGLPNNPIYANPVANFNAATRRQRWVLQRMRRTGLIDDAQLAQAQAEKIVLRSSGGQDVNAAYVAEMARRAVVDRLGEKAYTEGIRVITSLRADDQRAAHAALRRAVLAHERRQPWRGPEEQNPLPDDAAEADRAASLVLKEVSDDEDLRAAVVLAASPREVKAKLASGETVVVKGEALRWVQAALQPQARDALAIRRGSVLRLQALPNPKAPGKAVDWTIAQWPEAEAAFVALDPATGRIRALVGGFDFNRRQFNHVTHAARQPGSSFKPFLYAAAFENGVMPETIVEDAPLTDADGGVPNWNPKNSDDRFDGDLTVREGLVRSKNLVSIRLLKHIGLDAARTGIGRFGFDMTKHPENLTLALGTGSVTPLQMAQGYAVFANGGFRVAPVLIERIVGAKGEVLFEAPPPAPLLEENRAVSARNVFITNTLLADVTLRGTAARAQATLKRPDLYGKTGTTNDAVDAWFAGWAPGVVAVGWMGYDEPASLGERESGGGLALPIWVDSLARMLKGVAVQALVPPEGVVPVNGDWRYTEWAEGGFVPRIGAARTEPPAPAASAASEAPR